MEQKGIAHCDVKPANVILIKNNDKNDDFMYCVSDFGISFMLEKNQKLIPCQDLCL